MANLTLRPNKCEFAKPEILYLGHLISREGITVDPSKIEAVSFNVLKAFSQSLVHLKLISFVNKRFNGVAIFA
jgi:hypothetical protein